MSKLDFALCHIASGSLLTAVVIIGLFLLLWSGVSHLLGLALFLAVATKGLLLLWLGCVILSALTHGLTNIIKR